MPDLIDEILEKLSPSSLELLDEIDLESSKESRKCSENLEKSLAELEEMELKRCIREIDNKTDLLRRKTGKYKAFFDTCNQQLEKINHAGASGDNNKKIKMYADHINILEKQLHEVTKKLNVEELFVDINEIHRKTEELEIKKRELTEAVKCYEGFPASVKEAEHCISDLKEKIKKKEAMLE